MNPLDYLWAPFRAAWIIYRRERAISKLQAFLESRTGRPISREEALQAHRRWRERNPR